MRLGATPHALGRHGIAALLVVLAHAATAQSTMFRGGPTHTGAYPTVQPELVGLAWRVPTDGEIVSSPAVDGNDVFVGSGDGSLYAIDLTSGSVRWRLSLGAAVNGSPALHGAIVIVSLRGNRVVAVDRRTGSVQWRFTGGSDAAMPWGHETGNAFTSSPVVTDGTVLVGTNDGKLYALDAQHGRLRWAAAIGAPIWSSPAVATNRVFVGASDGVLYCLDLKSGEPRWRFETEGSRIESRQFGFDRRTIQSSPAVANGTVYFGSRDGFLYAVSADSGKLVWRYDHQTSWVNDSPAVADRVVYVGTSDNSFFHAIDAATGKELWRTSVGGVIWSSPAVSGDLVVFGDGIGRLHALDRRTGADRWMFRTGESIHSSPVVAGDLIVVGSADRALYALRTGTESPQRLVLYDSTLRRASSAQDPDLIARYFENRGFRRVDAAALKGVVDSGGARRRVVVYAVDAGIDSAVLHTLLSSGAKVVWPSVLPPLIWPPDSATGRRTYAGIAWDAPGRLLSVDFSHSTFDEHAAQPTALGRQLGLDQFRSAWGVRAEGMTRVLATDDWGQAVAWQKSYGGVAGGGFFRVPSSNLLAAYLVSEWWGIER